nr:hypothetical protein HK105_006527 [Polyrhizophydium stewartii]
MCGPAVEVAVEVVEFELVEETEAVVVVMVVTTVTTVVIAELVLADDDADDWVVAETVMVAAGAEVPYPITDDEVIDVVVAFDEDAVDGEAASDETDDAVEAVADYPSVGLAEVAKNDAAAASDASKAA